MQRGSVIQASEQKSTGYHAYRIAPAIAKRVMDPFLHVSIVQQQDPSFARPQAGYTSFFWVEHDSPGGLVIETGNLGSRIVNPGDTLALFCGRGVLCRTKPQKKSVRYLQADVKISTETELLDAHWRTCTAHGESGYSIPGHDPDIYVGLSSREPEKWNKKIQLVGSRDGAQWSTVPLSETDMQWFIQGEPLQEPMDVFSSLAMSDRVRNKLVLLEYKRGGFGDLPL